MMRIHRDTRFAKDKSPYKTAVMARFHHTQGSDGVSPSFFLRLYPGGSVAGAGIWHPEPAALARIRNAIAGDARGWQKLRSGRKLGSGCAMAGESLTRPPRGFAADHPCIEDLKRKDFALTLPLDERRIASASFMGDVVAAYAAGTPFLRFISAAVGLPF
jgi:uncharacterized protein (TIGR02453 family)